MFAQAEAQETSELAKPKKAMIEDDLEVAETHYGGHYGGHYGKKNRGVQYQYYQPKPQPVYVGKFRVDVCLINYQRFIQLIKLNNGFLIVSVFFTSCCPCVRDKRRRKKASPTEASSRMSRETLVS